MYTLDITVGERSGVGTYPDWPAAREKIVQALTKFEPHVPTREMCMELVMTSDIETVGALTLVSENWRIVCQGVPGEWWPKRAEAATTVVGE